MEGSFRKLKMKMSDIIKEGYVGIMEEEESLDKERDVSF